jgi:hypothetical protein
MAEQLFKLKNLREIPIEYEINNVRTIPCRIKGTHKIGQYFGNMYVENTKWAIVLLGGNSQPEFIDARLIEVLKMKWEEL